jgi:hypothetical protein
VKGGQGALKEIERVLGPSCGNKLAMNVPKIDKIKSNDFNELKNKPVFLRHLQWTKWPNFREKRNFS